MAGGGRLAHSACALVVIPFLIAVAPAGAQVTRSTGSCPATDAQLFFADSAATSYVNFIPAVAPLADDTVGFGQKSFTPTSTDVTLVYANPTDACTSLTGAAYTGNYVLAARGTCSFFQKALMAQRSGAAGIVVFSSVSGDAISNMVMPTPAPPQSEQIEVQAFPVYGIDEAEYTVMTAGKTLVSGSTIADLKLNFRCLVTTTVQATTVNVANKTAVQNQWDTLTNTGVFDTYNPIVFSVSKCSDPLVSDKDCIKADSGCTEGYYCPYGNIPLDVVAKDTWAKIQCNTSDPNYDPLTCCSANITTGFIECKCPLGFYCPINTSQPLYCFEGFYCDIPARIRKCPSGHFCPFATAEPLECSPLDICNEESKIPNRILLLVVLVVFFIVLHFAFRAYADYLRHNNTRADKDLAEYHREREHRLTLLQHQVNQEKLPEEFARRRQSHNHSQTGRDVNAPPSKQLTKVVDPATGEAIGERSAVVLHIPAVSGEGVSSGTTVSFEDKPVVVTSSGDDPSVGVADAHAEAVPLIDQEHHKYDVEFRDIGLTLPSGQTVMEGVTGKFLSGRCCAIMGPSGAGKTTIISLVAGKYAKTHGQIFMNGHEVSGLRAWKKELGFVPQDDVMHRELTVRENIEFSAKLRLPAAWNKDEIHDHVDWIIDTLDLAHVQNTIIGDEKKRGISGGQRKRVNIGIELAGFPSVLFLDEPTSGLDSTTATELCVTLRKLAEDHKLTVVAVIHSPTPKAYTQFHDLLLLQKGGRTAYYGELAAAPALMSGVFRYEQLDPMDSPADYVLNVVSGRVHRHPTDKELAMAEGHEEVTCADLYLAWRDHVAVNGHSDLHLIEGLDGHRKHKRNLGIMGLRTHYEHAFEQARHTWGARVAAYARSLHKSTMHSVTRSVSGAVGVYAHDAEKNAVPRRTKGMFGQYVLCTKRAFHQLFADPSALMFSLAIHIGLGFALAIAVDGRFVGPYPWLFCTYASAPALYLSCTKPLLETYGVSGMIVSFAICFSAVATSVSTFGAEQVTYFRECQAGLRTLPYFLGKFTVDIVLFVLEATLFLAGFAIMYASPGNWGDLYGLIILFYFFGWSIGYMLSTVVSPQAGAIAGVGSAVLWCILLGGFTPTLVAVDSSFSGLSWLWDLSGPRWGIEAYFLNQVDYYRTSPFNPAENYINVTSALDKYGYKQSNYNNDFLYLVLISLGWAVLAMVTMMLTNHRRKE